jgi:hypothetical protein
VLQPLDHNLAVDQSVIHPYELNVLHLSYTTVLFPVLAMGACCGCGTWQATGRIKPRGNPASGLARATKVTTLSSMSPSPIRTVPSALDSHQIYHLVVVPRQHDGGSWACVSHTTCESDASPPIGNWHVPHPAPKACILFGSSHSNVYCGLWYRNTGALSNRAWKWLQYWPGRMPVSQCLIALYRPIFTVNLVGNPPSPGRRRSGPPTAEESCPRSL